MSTKKLISFRIADRIAEHLDKELERRIKSDPTSINKQIAFEQFVIDGLEASRKAK